MNKILITLAVPFLLWSCDVPIQLDLNQSESKVVIEGLVTDQPGRQYVKISRSVDFYDSGQVRVTNAIVTVTDDLNQVFLFVHNPENKDERTGYYVPVVDFVGQIGRTYTLTVNIDEETYNASDKLFSVSPLDKVDFRINEEEKRDPEIRGRFYETLIFTKEPPDTKDFYLFKLYRNDSIKYGNANDIYFSDDEYLSDNIDGFALPVFYAPGDIAKVEAYSISRSCYVFYSDMQKLLNNDGGLFGSPPANCRNNIDNGALGFFQASAMNIKEVVIEE